MTTRPIMFSGPMVRAILAGDKTQTRRVVKAHHPAEAIDAGVICSAGPSNGSWSWLDSSDLLDAGIVGREFRCPYGVPGDRLWVRETWQAWDGDPVCVYRADDEGREVARWSPSIYMPRWASRIMLEVSDVRVQRLQEIRDEDAIAEGIPRNPSNVLRADEPLAAQLEHLAFRDLWDSINAKRAPWGSNPWVWAITFRRVAP